MSKRKAIRWISVFVTMAGLALFLCAYVVLTLFAVPVSPVEYKAPPDLAQQVGPSADSIAVGAGDDGRAPATPTFTGPTADEIKTLARSVLFEGQSSERFIALFGHPDRDVREAAAIALALCFAANGGMIEPRAEGPEFMRRWELMESFWASADKPTVLKALNEVVSESVETGGSEFRGNDDLILYLLAWSPGQNSQRAEILAWVANHHPREGMRRSAVFFLVANSDFDREIGDEVLDSRAHDPALRVRAEALKQRIQRHLTFGRD
jgi:hypothetical protein